MFEAILREEYAQAGHGHLGVESAGILKEAAGKPANDKAVISMRKLGLDISKHVSRWIGDLNMNEFCTVLCMEPEVLEAVRALPLAPRTQVILVNEEGGGIPNPWQKDQSAYDECAKLIWRIAGDMALALRD